MARSLRLLSITCLATTLPALAGCHVAGCRAGDQVCAMLGEGSTSNGSTTQVTATDATGETTSAEPDVTTGATTLTDPGTTTLSEGECGDAVINTGEECDDGNDADDDACLPTCEFAACGAGHTHVGTEECDDGDDDDTDECTGTCTLARCGDGFVHPPEICDAGKANSDNIYGGCGSTCQPGPGCGDGQLNGPEDCDDQNNDPGDGCLADCVEATSCEQILERTPGAPSGVYRLWPTALGGGIDVPVYCDMETDGGGYTFMKVDTQIANASDKGAASAETICVNYGMHLFVPRTPDHLKSAYAIAVTDNVKPVGGGQIGKGAEYLAILAIFPRMVGATCDGKGLNSVDCPLWRARDDEQFWVTDKPIADEPSNEHCEGCSMFYKWNPDGTLKSYTTFPVGEGASSYRFLCDIGDKF